MEIVASAGAVRAVREGGGRLFVWASGHACCGGTRFIESATEPPADAGRFEHVEFEGVQLFVRPANGRLPDELHIEVKGRRRPRVEAYWDGCVYLV